jgi:tetratricopeptide (TPR) repeat protein
MAKKRKTRKELLKKPDEFLTTTSRTIQWITQNLKLIGLGIGILTLFLVIFTGTRFYLNYAENDASIILEQNLVKFFAAEKKEGPAIAYQQVENEFNTFLNKYGSKTTGKLGRIHFANICYKAGQYDLAANLFQQSLASAQADPSLKDLVISGLAYSYEALEKHPDAISYFEMILSGENEILKDEALFHLGGLYIETNQPEKSKQMYEQLLKNHPNSLYNKVVEDYLAGG